MSIALAPTVIAGGAASDTLLRGVSARLEELAPDTDEWASAASEFARRDPQRARTLLATLATPPGST